MGGWRLARLELERTRTLRGACSLVLGLYRRGRVPAWWVGGTGRVGAGVASKVGDARLRQRGACRLWAYAAELAKGVMDALASLKLRSGSLADNLRK